MTKTITERDQAYFGIFVTALEGGINYWATCSRYVWTQESGHEDPLGFHATICDSEDPSEQYEVNRSVIATGVKRFIKHAKEKGFGEYFMAAARDLDWARWDNLDYDADIADAIVQFGLFGELVYG